MNCGQYHWHFGGAKPRRWCLWLAVAVLLAAQLPVVSAESNPQVGEVLILYSYGREYSPFNVMAGTFRTELAERSQKSIKFYEATVEAVESDDLGANEQPLVAYLKALFAHRRLDLIVALGGPATLFVSHHRADLFPNVPMIATMDQRRFAPSSSPANVMVVPLQLQLPGLIEDILQIFPATTNIAVVLGAEPLSRYWTEQCKREFIPFTNHIAFAYYNDLSLEQMCQRVSALPPDSAILFGAVAVDAAGIPHEQESALAAIHASAKAPVFGAFQHQLGKGIVGGRLTSSETWGHRVAGAALQILNGEPLDQIQTQPTGPGKPIYDWRELNRWNVGQRRLPSGAIILFRDPTPWEQHKWTIIGGTSLVLLEALLIGGLILQLRRRRRAEAVARESELAARTLSGRLIHTQEEEQARIARDLHDDFNQRLALLSVEIDLLGQRTSETDSTIKLKQLGEHVCELSSDVHRLAYQLHPAKLDQLGLVSALNGLCRDLSQKSGLKIDFIHDDIPRNLPASVAIAVFRVVQESLRNVVRHSEAKQAQVELSIHDGSLRLLVSDKGKGFDPESSQSAAGLGLLSMRERVRLLQGVVKIQSRPGDGTQVDLTIPLPNEETTV